MVQTIAIENGKELMGWNFGKNWEYNTIHNNEVAEFAPTQFFFFLINLCDIYFLYAGMQPLTE